MRKGWKRPVPANDGTKTIKISFDKELSDAIIKDLNGSFKQDKISMKSYEDFKNRVEFCNQNGMIKLSGNYAIGFLNEFKAKLEIHLKEKKFSVNTLSNWIKAIDK